MKKEMKIGIIVVSIVVAIIIVLSGVNYIYNLSQSNTDFLGGEVFQVSGGSSFCGPGCDNEKSVSGTLCEGDFGGCQSQSVPDCDPKCKSGCKAEVRMDTYVSKVEPTGAKCGDNDEYDVSKITCTTALNKYCVPK